MLCDKDEILRKIIKSNLKGNPYLKHACYENKDIETFLRTHATEDQIKAYLSINPNYGAARADFFRYAVMFYKGGVYLDIKSFIVSKTFLTGFGPMTSVY